MNAAIILAVAISIFFLGYRFYSKFIANKILHIDPSRTTPSVQVNDGKDYIPTKRSVVFFYHYATIAGAGVLIGPTLAVEYGWLPCIIWILAATCLAGGVHDLVIMFASVRHGGKSVGEIARKELGRIGGSAVMIGILFLAATCIAGLGLGVVTALENNPWGAFSAIMTIPVALFVGVYMRHIRPGKIAEASLLGVGLILAFFFIGSLIPESSLVAYFTLTKGQLTIIIGLYAFVAAILPTDLLLVPRDYLSAYIKAGVIALLVVGVFLVHPDFNMPPITQYIQSGGPVIPGALWPFLFIVITCGAISGWHSLCCSGVTPKLVRNERDIRPVAYGGWLLESLCAVVALSLAAIMIPGDYFAINSSPTAYAQTGLTPVLLPEISESVGMNLQAKTGGIVSFAVGMTQVFSNILGGKETMVLWYQFSILFLAIFTMAIMDHGTRMSRFFFQEVFGWAHKSSNPTNHMLGAVFAAGISALFWVYLLYTGEIGIIWPIFGICNILLASIGLIIGTSFIMKRTKPIYGLVTFWPVFIFATAAIYGAFLKIVNELIPAATLPASVQSSILIIVTVLVLLVLVEFLKQVLESYKRRT
ncbi:MAG: carbon starvation protein A [archaeon]|nr:carbon starvation protein A [archaeon]